VDWLDCYALSSGSIEGYSRGVLVGVASLRESLALADVAHLLGWVRWVRTIARRAERTKAVTLPEEKGAARIESTPKKAQILLNLPVRANLQIARRIDEQAAAERSADLFAGCNLRKAITAERKDLQVVELFAGAGGMGLGFLNAEREDGRRYRVIASAEIHPVYTHTLAHNHRVLRDQRLVPDDAVPDCSEPMDLRTAEAADRIRSAARNAGGVDVLIGGPPCQGFSSANRNSWSSSNPNNQLVDTFIDYVGMLRPRVFLMENVQGILWTPQSDRDSRELSVAEHVVARLAGLGYQVHVKLLDAAWYGVPQHRSRFFLLGIHQELGYHRDLFGAWGPFPAPTHGPGTQRSYVAIAEAIRDLPEIANGGGGDELPYTATQPPADSLLRYLRHGAPGDVIWDHVASRHAGYVIERYRRIPPGGNWQDVADMMTNYADVDRTHSNIYRRLVWDDPSITIGHYRKSMIVHPSQHRGLSLREAARLQSFPDWFRFAGSPQRLGGGLSYKQQQLANAVCPLVTRAVADFVLDL
jgi:DNA-cytosine methyltransferase